MATVPFSCSLTVAARIGSNHAGLLVNSENGAKAVRDLAYGAIGPDAFEDRGHQVVASTGGGFESIERRLRAARIAPGAQPPQLFHLPLSC